MTQTRREFIAKSGVAIAGTVLLPSCLSNTKASYLFLSASHSPAHATETVETRTQNPFIAVFDSRTGETALINSPSYIHSIVQNPANKFQFLCVPKLQKTAFLYDHNNGSIRELDADGQMLFYGHATFSVDGRRFFAAQSQDGNTKSLFTRSAYKGFIAGYNTNTLAKLSEIDSFGNDPHDMKFLDQDRVVVANGGAGTNISIVNLKDGSLEKTYPCNLRNISCRHLIVTKKEIFVLSMVRNQNDAISHLLYPNNGELVAFGNTMVAQERLRTQLLSGVTTDKHVITTAPMMNAVHFWNKETFALDRVEDYERASGAVHSLDKTKVIITSAFENSALEYDPSGSTSSYNEQYKLITGPHTLLAAI